VKVWIFKGEVFEKTEVEKPAEGEAESIQAPSPPPPAPAAAAEPASA